MIYLSFFVEVVVCLACVFYDRVSLYSTVLPQTCDILASAPLAEIIEMCPHSGPKLVSVKQSVSFGSVSFCSKLTEPK
jgi:hypothetical protein